MSPMVQGTEKELLVSASPGVSVPKATAAAAPLPSLPSATWPLALSYRNRWLPSVAAVAIRNAEAARGPVVGRPVKMALSSSIVSP